MHARDLRDVHTQHTAPVVMDALAVLLLYLILGALDIGCPIRFLTGISCAGCGMTRAVLAAFRLDFQAAFYFHPLYWLLLPTSLVLLFRRKIPAWIFKTSLTLVVIAFVVVWIVRLFFVDSVLEFSPQDGAFFRLLEFLSGKLSL